MDVSAAARAAAREIISEPMIGHNNPPEPTPFERSRTEIEGLVMEAHNWADGVPIDSQMMADALGELIEKIRLAIKQADARRDEEKKPLDEQVKAIQAKYNALIGDTKTVKGSAVLALDACKKVLTPWLLQLEEKLRENARLAREEADRLAAEAKAAFRLSDPTDLAGREAAEQVLQNSRDAQALAKRTEKAKAQSTGGTRAIGLRTKPVVTMTDAMEALKHYRTKRPEKLKAFLQELAEADARAGILEIPGFTITKEKVV